MAGGLARAERRRSARPVRGTQIGILRCADLALEIGPGRLRAHKSRRRDNWRPEPSIIRAGERWTRRTGDEDQDPRASRCRQSPGLLPSTSQLFYRSSSGRESAVRTSLLNCLRLEAECNQGLHVRDRRGPPEGRRLCRSRLRPQRAIRASLRLSGRSSQSGDPSISANIAEGNGRSPSLTGDTSSASPAARCKNAFHCSKWPSADGC
jgi:hypothetical protein